MSASNWAACPRCARRHEAALAEKEREVAAACGAVSPAEHENFRAVLRAVVAAYGADKPREEFREDYEIHGAAKGVVHVGYHGECQTCGLTLAFSEDHPIPGVFGS